MKTGRERYHSDPAFKQLVDLMLHHIITEKFTPSEMRDAAMCASMQYEMLHPRALFISTESDRLAAAFPELTD